LLRQKDTQNRYLLAPDRDLQTGTVTHLWNCPVIQTSQLVDGTALVLSLKRGAAVGWIRQGLTVEFNPYGTDEWTKNYGTWRAELRVSLSTPRPSAINVITSLPVA
jgi:HK97 family phage major capsid protein